MGLCCAGNKGVQAVDGDPCTAETGEVLEDDVSLTPLLKMEHKGPLAFSYDGLSFCLSQNDLSVALVKKQEEGSGNQPLVLTRRRLGF